MIHIAEKSDVELLTKMIKKFCTQSKEIRFGNFVFGPPVIRLFHYLQDPDSALKLFKDESLEQNGFFDQLISYQLLLDLLYETGRYQDILDTFDIIKSRQVEGGRYPKHVFVLALAACYKLNTPESLERAIDLFKDSTARGNVPMRKGYTFFAALALQQSKPHITLEVVSNVRQQTYLTVRTLKVLALADLKRYEDAVPILRSVLEIDNPMINKQTFPADAIEYLKKSFEGNNNKDLQADFEKVVGFLEKHGHLTNETLDQILCSEIKEVINNNQDQGEDRYRRDNRNYRNFTNEAYGRDNRRGFQNRDFDYQNERTRRPGLHELN